MIIGIGATIEPYEEAAVGEFVASDVAADVLAVSTSASKLMPGAIISVADNVFGATCILLAAMFILLIEEL